MIDRYRWEHFIGSGILMTKLSDEDLQPIKDEIKEIQNNFSTAKKANDTLAGNIAHEYQLSKTTKYIETLVLPHIAAYEKKFKYLEKINIVDRDLPIGIRKFAWVNFMKKHEFNPVHNHSGVISFVIWIDVPYSMEDELKQNYCKDSNMPLPGHFQFLYTDFLGKITTFRLPIDKTYNNTIAIFPAQLHHQVYPFSTSDEYRISVSGNYKLIA